MHVIRLRYPWEKQKDGESQWLRVDVPESPGPVSPEPVTWNYRRRFNLPTGLEPGCTVTLRVESWQGRLEWAAINGAALPNQGPPLDAEITPHLTAHNVLSIRLGDLPDRPAGIDGPISLAIHEHDASD